MARTSVLLIALMVLPVSAGAVGIGQAGGHGLRAPEWVPGPNPQAPVGAAYSGAVGRAQEAIGAAVGIPEAIRERLMTQVGGQLGRANEPETARTQSMVGLDLAAQMAAHANTVGNRPESVPGLDNAAGKVPDMARQALSRVPIEWVRNRFAN